MEEWHGVYKALVFPIEKKIEKALSVSKTDKVIKSFSKLRTTSNGLIRFKILAEEQSFILAFCISKGNSTSTCFLVEKCTSSHFVQICLKPNIGADFFNNELKNIITRHLLGFKNENDFFEVLSIFWELNPNLIESITKSNKFFDVMGSDFRIRFYKYKDKRIQISLPIQLKSSRQQQLIHIKKFPHIPSIVWQRKFYTNEQAFVLVEKIMTDYLNGKISHL